MSEIIDHIIVVRFDMLSKVAPDLLTKNGIIVYAMKFISTKLT